MAASRSTAYTLVSAVCLLQLWHLRSGSNHPCAQQLGAAMSGLPRGAQVLLVLGEIDCREGLFMAVEKMKVSY